MAEADYQYPTEVEEIPEIKAPTPRLDNALSARRAPTRGTSMLDDVANDLALWIDQTSTEVALAFSPARAPFSAQITEQQKLEFYRTRLFNPDGSPNTQGRAQEIARLGAEGFGRVYKAVVGAYPELKPPPSVPMDSIDELAPMPGGVAATAGPPSGMEMPPGVPPMPMPTPPGMPPVALPMGGP